MGYLKAQWYNDWMNDKWHKWAAEYFHYAQLLVGTIKNQIMENAFLL